MDELFYRQYLKEIRISTRGVDVLVILDKLKDDKSKMKMSSETIKEYNRTVRELKKKTKIKGGRSFKNNSEESSGEKRIKEYLIDRQINFEQEKEFDDLCNPKSNCKLRFDFYLPDYNILIEFDGRQHFEYVKKFDRGDKRKLLSRQYRDKLKNNYCLSKKITLIRIPYTEYFNIEKILDNYFQK